MIINVWILLVFSSSLLLHLASPVSDTYPDVSCQPRESTVHFRFCLKQLQPHEGWFDLSCNGPGQTTINLPPTIEFIEASILYSKQFILLTDPGNPLPRWFQRLFVPGPQWIVPNEFTSALWLSDRNFTVVAVPTEDWEHMKGMAISGCVRNWTVLVPSTGLDFRGDDMLIDSIGLMWSGLCGECHAHGAVCGFKEENKGLATTTRINWEPEPEGNPQIFELLEDLPKSDASDSQILVGIGLPCLMVISVVCCIRRKTPLQGQDQQDQTDPASSTGQVEAVLLVMGLDTPTIESYPKTQIGDGGLPLPGDGTCSICLMEYRLEEIVMMIPECNHYFHARCIGPWLKRNASCPLCRNHQGLIDTTV